MNKDDAEASAQAWMRKAEMMGYRCTVCGDLAIYEERDIYFERKLCGPHAARADKDD